MGGAFDDIIEGSTADVEIAYEGATSTYVYDGDGKRIPHSAEGFEDIPGDLIAAMLRVRTQVIQGVAMPAPLESGSSTKGSPDAMASPTTTETTEAQA